MGAAAAAWLAAGLAAGATPAVAAGLELQPVRPRVSPQAAPIQPPVRTTRTPRPRVGQLPAKPHLSCIGWLDKSDWWAAQVRLENDGAAAIPPGTTVYYWFIKDHRWWNRYTLAGGLARGQSMLAPLNAPAGGGDRCQVSFRKQAWMQLNPPSHRQLKAGQKQLAPGAGLPGTSNTEPDRASYRVGCKERWVTGFGAAITPGGVTLLYLDITNVGRTSIPSGVQIFYFKDGHQAGSTTLTNPLRPGQHISVKSYAPYGNSKSCSAQTS